MIKPKLSARCFLIAALVATAAIAPGCRRLETTDEAWPETSSDRAEVKPAQGTPIAIPVVAGGSPSAPMLSLSEGFAPIVERVGAAVVNIAAEKSSREEPNDLIPLLRDPFFRDFFDNFGPRDAPRGRGEHAVALGSGVIVSENGYVLTNNHVIEDTGQVRVALPDKREFVAKIIGGDPKTDIAVLKIEAKGLPVVPMGDSTKVRVGDFALAIGNPFGLGQTVTMGIISAVGRGNIGITDYEDFIQTDAAINPGNSGGALVNYAGELIGINTAILSRGAQGNQGIGFAVPARMAREVMNQIVAGGRVVRGFLGVSIQEITPALSEAMGLGTTSGALIAEITPGSPAAAAGLSRGDVIVTLNAQPVVDARTFRMAIAEVKPGSRVTLGVMRRGARREVPVTLGEMPPEPPPSR